jgi:hypothetical protein
MIPYNRRITIGIFRKHFEKITDYIIVCKHGILLPYLWYVNIIYLPINTSNGFYK